MAEIIFDSLKHTKDLEKVGVPAQQAEKHVEIMGKIINTHLATKDEIFAIRKDFDLLRGEFDLLRKDFSILRNDFEMLRKDFDLLRKDVELAISDLRHEFAVKMEAGFKDQNRKMIAYFTIAVAVLSFIIKN